MIRETLAGMGSDRHLIDRELHDVDGSVLGDAWTVYSNYFDRFTGSRMDPQFARLDHPASCIAQPKVAPDTTIVIAGSGPSLAERAADLRRLRQRLSIWTSIRGAEALAAHGITADLIAVQHSTDLDAYFTTRHLRDRDGVNPLSTAPVVLAEPKTPAALLKHVDPQRLAAFDPAYGWGLWPASLAWMACGSGAGAVSLVGIDLGDATERIDALQQPLASLLRLIALGAPIATVDAGSGPTKVGWSKRALDATVGAIGSSAVELDRSPSASLDERRAALEDILIEIDDHIDAAAMFQARALECRAAGDRRQEGPLGEAWQILLSWRESPSMRVAFQEGLGVRFLPRFWREPNGVAGPVWRPVLLAVDEIVRQAQTARARLGTLVTQ